MCKVLLQWGKDFHYFIILYLNHLWKLDVQALEISLPLKNRDCSLVTHGYIQLPEISRPWKEQGSTLLVAPGNIHVLKLYRPWKKTRDCTASRYWKYPGPGKIQGVSLGAPWNFPGGKKEIFNRRLIGHFGLNTGGENLFERDFVIRFWKIGNQCN